MSDKELLELEAKAVGMHVNAQRVDADDKFTHLVVGQKFKPEKIDWNPLTNTPQPAAPSSAQQQRSANQCSRSTEKRAIILPVPLLFARYWGIMQSP